MQQEPQRRYSYLGPVGTFTEAALRQVPEARGQEWHAVANVPEALANVTSGHSHAAMIAIENSVEGGVTVTQDALATTPGLQIIGEYLVPVSFVLVTRPGVTFEQLKAEGRPLKTAAHPVAYGQCRAWFEQHLPDHFHVAAASNVQAAADLLAPDSTIDVAIAPPGIVDHYDVSVVAERIADNPDAVTRFVLVTQPAPVGESTGADKTSLLVELPEDRSGALLQLLEQFAARGANLTLLASRPIGDRMGRYRFVIDAEGHVRDERVADALLGVKRYSPRVTFLGSYPRADRSAVSGATDAVGASGSAGTVGATPSVHDDARFAEARDWLRGIISGRPEG